MDRWFGNCPGWVRTAVGRRGRLPSLLGRTDGSASEAVRAHQGRAQPGEGRCRVWRHAGAVRGPHRIGPAAVLPPRGVRHAVRGDVRPRRRVPDPCADDGRDGGGRCALDRLGVRCRGQGLGVLAAFVVTLAAGLMVKFGGHRFFAAVLLNVWFIVALGLPTLFHLNRVTVHAWSQALAWLITSAFWIVITCGLWLIRGRGPQPTHFPEIPGDTTIRALTRPIILYAVIRAVAVSAAVAIAFGLHLHYAFWMPLSTVVAMKPGLQQGTLAVEQRLVGTILGAVVAALLLLTVHDKHALDVVIVVLGGLAGSIFTVNFALFTAALTALILTALDLPDPTNFATEGKRVLFTFVGVGIAAIVMLLADRLQKRQTPAAPPAH